MAGVSIGMGKFQDLSGMKFGRLTVLSRDNVTEMEMLEGME